MVVVVFVVVVFVVVEGASLVLLAGWLLEDSVVVVPVAGARDKYFCFISSAVNGAPVLRIPEPVELSDPVLESEEALLAAGGCASCADVLLWKKRKQKKNPKKGRKRFGFSRESGRKI